MPKRAGMGADLVDELAAEGIVLLQHLGPQIRVHALQDVARLHLEQRVPVRASHQRLVAGATLVGHAGQIGIALLAVPADHLRACAGTALSAHSPA